jgi:hypothetical protein
VGFSPLLCVGENFLAYGVIDGVPVVFRDTHSWLGQNSGLKPTTTFRKRSAGNKKSLGGGLSPIHPKDLILILKQLTD